ncbi:PREDICTED: condensin complex subunit 2-like [Priapulus caudatus]|uniref:Condensin complex subunit 2 n=1 Tax=Priapulus caudatus TaxID=37621 RepID=A0ABM1EGD3_PRICU|nr:PREDICTED: condensin complex subunit 2-like [Priapulus caudatus]
MARKSRAEAEFATPAPVHGSDERLHTTGAQESDSSATHRRMRSFGSASTFGNLPENDDDTERRERQRQRIVQMQQKTLNSPATPTDRRRSIGGTYLTNALIAEHYANCIKMSSENKITVKNAFNLHLIDYMAEMLSKKGELTNFQVASCTLDAGAKIYACRVDAVHSEVCKIAGGLGHTGNALNNRPAEGEEGEEGIEDNNEEGTKKRTKRVRKVKTLVTNLNTINVKTYDIQFDVDPLFQKTSAAFDEGGTRGLLLNSLAFLDDAAEVVLDSSRMRSGREELLASVRTDEPLMSANQLAGVCSNVVATVEICPVFADFEFTSWKQDADRSFDVGDSEHANAMKGQEHAFDINAPVEPIEDFGDREGRDFTAMDDYDGGGDDFSDGGDNEATRVTADGVEMRAASHQDGGEEQRPRVNSIGDLVQMLAEEGPSEYSYFSATAGSMWAGPGHWKLKLLNKGVKATIKKKKKAKKTFLIDFDEDLDFKAYFSKSKASTVLSKATIVKHKKSDVTLPEDMDYGVENLFKLYLKPCIKIRKHTGENELKDERLQNYDYNNANDCHNYCAADGENYDDDDTAGFGLSQDCDFTDRSGFITQMAQDSDAPLPSGLEQINEEQDGMLAGDNLVAVPRKVMKIDIAYAKAAKRMDVKKLKTAMWSILTTDTSTEGSKLNESNPVFESDVIEKPKSFKKMYKELPSKLSKKMEQNLSIPIGFVCFLHLCNEKCLKLVGTNDLSDFVIQQGS